MKLKATTDGQSHDVQITRRGDEMSALVNDRAYDLVVSQPEPGVFLIKDGPTVYEAAVSKSADGHSAVRVKGHDFEIAITDPKRLRGGGIDAEHASGRAEIKTVMPGKVVRILKQTGAAVTMGEGVIVVEAMKMQNEMRSPKDGTIGRVKVAEGDTVGAGDVLVVIE